MLRAIAWLTTRDTHVCVWGKKKQQKQRHMGKLNNLYFNLDWTLTKPFSLVQALGELLIHSLSRALRVFLINNPSVSTQFPYGLWAKSSTFFVSCGLSCSFSVCFTISFISSWSWQFVHRFLCLYCIASSSNIDFFFRNYSLHFRKRRL